MILELSNTFKNIERKLDLRAVIVIGAGHKAFSAGTDISELTGADKYRARELSALAKRFAVK